MFTYNPSTIIDTDVFGSVGVTPIVKFRFADDALGVIAGFVHELTGNGPLDAAHVARAYMLADNMAASIIRENGNIPEHYVKDIDGIDKRTGLAHKWDKVAVKRELTNTLDGVSVDRVTVSGHVKAATLTASAGDKSNIDTAAYNRSDAMLADTLASAEEKADKTLTALANLRKLGDASKREIETAQADVDGAATTVDNINREIDRLASRKGLSW